MRVATWNLLARDFALPARYPEVDSTFLWTPYRNERILSALETFSYDLLALQEITPDLVERIGELVGPGRVHWTKRAAGRFDGTAFVLGPDTQMMFYQAITTTRGGESIHPAQFIRVMCEDITISVANVHLSWIRASADQAEPLEQLSSVMAILDATHGPHVILGDSSAEPGSPVRSAIAEAGFSEYQGPGPTGYVNGHTISVDVIAARWCEMISPLRPAITEPLPTFEIPSDHVLLYADVLV